MNKSWMYLIGLAAVVLIAFYFYRKYNVAPAVNFKGLRLVDMDNRPVNFETFKGKKTLVCFSASWCPNCIRELKEIDHVKDDLQDVEVVVISDEPLEKIRNFRLASGYPFVFLKMEQPFSAIGINAIPTSYLVNRQQNVTKETVGYLDWKDPSTRQHLLKLME